MSGSMASKASAINNGGHPMLNISTDGTDHGIRLPVTDTSGVSGAGRSSSQIEVRVLKAIASVLVRDNEILALTGHRNEDAYNLLAVQQKPPTTGDAKGLEDASDPVIEADDKEDTDDESDKSYLKTEEFNFTGLTAVANPHSDQIDPVHDLEDKYGVINLQGDSHWRNMDDTWDSVFKVTTPSKYDPLQNHVATLQDFIKEYSAAGPPTGEKANYIFLRITRYLVSCSIGKMVRRMAHWTSLGFVHIICKESIQKSEIEAAHAKCLFEVSERKDTNLGVVLRSLQGRNMLDELFSFWKIHFKSEDKESEPFKTILKQVADKRSIYSAPTCWEFHQLLVCALLGYQDALFTCSILQDEEKKNKKKDADSMKRREMSVIRVWDYSRLLWRIAYSKAFSRHSEVLACIGGLPEFRSKDDYYDMSRFFGSASEGDDFGESLDSEELRSIVEDRLGRVSNDYVANVYKRWIRLQVGHWSTIDDLASICANGRNKDIDIVLLNLKVPRNKSTETMNWHEGIEKVLSRSQPKTIKEFSALISADNDKNIDIARATEYLAGIINKYINAEKLAADQQVDAKKAEVKKAIAKQGEIEARGEKTIAKRLSMAVSGLKANPIFHLFGPLTVRPSGTVHCEAALAALKTWQQNSDLCNSSALGSKLISNATFNHIIVSKLCCPACSMLLQLLRDHCGASLFNVHGVHARVFPTCLPPWIPNEVSRKMIDEISHILSYQMLIMVKNYLQDCETAKAPRFRHDRKASGQSFFSILSKSSDDSIDSDNLREPEDEEV